MVEKAYGLEIPQSLEEACDPTRTALLVYDMQVGIIGQLKTEQKSLPESGQSWMRPGRRDCECFSRATCHCPKRPREFFNCGWQWRGKESRQWRK